MPPGLGFAANIRKQIMNAAIPMIEERKARDPNWSLSGSKAKFDSNLGGLRRLESQRALIMPFATTTELNLNAAEIISAKVNRTGIPVINRWLLAGKKSLAGDPDVAQFDAAIRTAINEYAKVTSTATGGGVTSDQSRKDIEGILNSSQTPEQIKAVMQLLRVDLVNRQTGYDIIANQLQEGLSGKIGGWSESKDIYKENLRKSQQSYSEMIGQMEGALQATPIGKPGSKIGRFTVEVE